MSGLLTLAIEDVPAQEAPEVNAVGVVKTVETREVSNGYTQVAVTLTYPAENGRDLNYTARWNVRAEWFTPDFKDQVATLDRNQGIQYSINMQKLTRGIFKAAGLAAIDFAALEGSRVGFKTRRRKDDASRTDINGFFAPPVTV